MNGNIFINEIRAIGLYTLLALSLGAANETLQATPNTWGIAFDFMNFDNYSTAVNPNGAWSYGSMTLDTNGLPTLNFQASPKSQGSIGVGWPFGGLWKNLGGSTNFGIPPGEVSENCDHLGTPCIRWAAPADDIYKIEGIFGQGDCGYAKGIRGVFLNSTEMWSEDRNNYTTNMPSPFSFIWVLSAGDTIDFIMWGWGAGCGNTPVSATITSLGSLSNSPPIITSQPQSQTTFLGANASFSVNILGAIPCNFQWQLNSTNYFGATNSTLIITNTGIPDAGPFQVVVNNNWGSVTSSIANLNILGVPVTFLSEPGNISYSNGQFCAMLGNLTGQGKIVVQTSSNLTDWVPVFTNPPAFGTLWFSDATASNFPSRFYRALTQ